MGVGPAAVAAGNKGKGAGKQGRQGAAGQKGGRGGDWAGDRRGGDPVEILQDSAMDDVLDLDEDDEVLPEY